MLNHFRGLTQMGLLLGLGLCVLSTGCKSRVNSTAASIEPSTVEPLGDSTDDESVETPIEPSGQLTSIDVGHVRPETRHPLADFGTPLGEEEDFFAAPKITAQVKEVTEVNPEYQTVRLLGFVHSCSKPIESRAILKMGEQMVFMSRGDVLEGLELLEINHRTISLQRGRDRWKLALLDQPVLNQPSPPRKPDWVKERGRPSSSVPVRSKPNDESATKLVPPAPPVPEANLPELPDVELPDIELPELPDLPDLDQILGPDFN